MSVTLDQLLALAGRLDDTPGFDTPRERFRRFLVEHVRDTDAFRALVEACQHSPGDQHHHALQDLVVLLGRSLGFDPVFGPYAPNATGVKHHGHWRSKSHLHLVIEVRSDRSDGANLDALARAVGAVASTARAPRVRPAGLCVIAPLCANRHAIEQSIDPAAALPIGVASLRTMLSLATMVSKGRLTHDEIVRFVELRTPLDFVVDLLERAAEGRVIDITPPVAAAPDVAEPAPAAEPEERAYWVATVLSDQAMSPEQVLQLVVGKRHVFGISNQATIGAVARRGDRLCFYIAGKGVVGSGTVRAIASGGAGIRDAERFRQLLHLDAVTLHLDAPRAPDADTDSRLRAAGSATGRHVQTMVRVSLESFEAMTSHRGAAKVIDVPRRASGGGHRI